MKKILCLSFLAAILAVCCSRQQSKPSNTSSEAIEVVEEEYVPNIKIDSVAGLKVIYPNFSRIDLVCQTMPSQDDESVIFVAEAAYTCKEYVKYPLPEFEHKYIAGDHVTMGVREKGYPCKANTGAFVYYDGDWRFLNRSYSHELDSAAMHGGMGFGQELIVHNYALLNTVRRDSPKNIYRALCEHSGTLCIVECAEDMSFGQFKAKLMELGVTHAIYLDMGSGWNHSWYRTEDGVVELHPKGHSRCTNWITFYRE
jgi:hypothetical protein